MMLPRPAHRSTYLRPIVLLPLVILFGIIFAGCAPRDATNGGAVSSPAAVSSPPSSPAVTTGLYFGNTVFNPGAQVCDAVFLTVRDDLPADPTPRQLLDALFAGPTQEEEDAGFTSFFSEETEGMVRDVVVQNRTAYVNLADVRTVIPNASTSCGSAQFQAEIRETLTQYPDIDRVILAIDGDPEPIYEWLQIGCTAENDNCDAAPFGEMDN